MVFPIVGGTQSTGYDIENSLRLNDGDSGYLTRAQSNGNQDKWTWSGWVKRSNTGSNQCIFATTDGSATSFDAKFNSDDDLEVYNYLGGGYGARLITNRKFRDVAAWYHIVIVYDSGNSTEAFRLRIYVNGTEESSFSTTNYPSLNADSDLNVSGSNIEIGRQANGGQYFDGYMAEIVLTDGQALDPTSFGEFDEDSPTIWKPKDVSGLTFGTNGFYLDFENSGALGTDVSGNSNNFTVNNLTSIDQSTDTCTNNFATLNALNMYYPGGTLSEGNLSHSGIPATNYASPFSTIAVSQGKWYVEFKITDVTNWISVGISGTIPDATNDYIGKAPADSWGYIGGSSAGGSNSLYHNSSGSTYGATYANNDIIGLYLDLDNNKLYFAKNGTIQNSGTGISITDPTSLPDGVYYIGAGGFSGSYTHGYQVNYGAGCPFTISSGNSDANGYGNFEYSPNDGGSASFDSSAKNFYALNTKNLSEFG